MDSGWSRDQNLTHIYKGVADWKTERWWGIIRLVTKHDAVQYQNEILLDLVSNQREYICAVLVLKQFRLYLIPNELV